MKPTTMQLAQKTSIGIGGESQNFFSVSNDRELEEFCLWARSKSLKSFVLGGGSNVVIGDNLDHLAICQLHQEKILMRPALSSDIGSCSPNKRRELQKLKIEELFILEAEAGVDWDELVAFSVKNGLSGIECLSGIPGHAGAAPIQNIGAYGQELSQVFFQLRALNIQSGKWHIFQEEDCHFSYRNSVFKSAGNGHYIISSISLILKNRQPEKPKYSDLRLALKDLCQDNSTVENNLKVIRQEVLKIRAQKGMLLNLPFPLSSTCGSFFTNPVISTTELERVYATKPGWRHFSITETPVFDAGNAQSKISAGWLIENCGLQKGYRHGNVGLSTKHTLALTNYGNATASEVRQFSNFIIEKVYDHFGVTLKPEARFIPDDLEEANP